MTAANKTVITLVGRTGDGKSTLGNELLKCLGMSDRPFSEENSAHAGTRVSTCVEYANTVVVDNPGLMDPSGVAQDTENITTIVTKARELGHLNMLVLVMNSKADRFDDGMQNALKLICDSFGKKSLDHLFVVYTKRFGEKDVVLNRKIEQIRGMINRRCQTSLDHLTYYAVENHPEEYSEWIGDEHVARFRTEAAVQLGDLLRAARALGQFSTMNSQAGEYDHVRELNAEKREHAESEARAAQEAALRRETEMREAMAEKEREMEREAERRREIERERERAEENRRAAEMERGRAEDRKRFEEAEERREKERQEERRSSAEAERRREREREDDRRRMEALIEQQNKKSLWGTLLSVVGGAVAGAPGFAIGKEVGDAI